MIGQRVKIWEGLLLFYVFLSVENLCQPKSEPQQPVEPNLNEWGPPWTFPRVALTKYPHISHRNEKSCSSGSIMNSESAHFLGMILLRPWCFTFDLDIFTLTHTHTDVYSNDAAIVNLCHLMARRNQWLKFCSTPKAWIFYQGDKNRYDFDSFTLDGYCCVGCCHFFLIWQSKGKEVSVPD